MPDRLLDQLSHHIRTRNYSIRTEQAYVQWTRRYILFHKKRHPSEMHDNEVIQYLSHLAIDRNVSPNTQNQALNALVFLYRNVIGNPLGDISSAVRAKKPQKLPVVLSRQEVKSLLIQLEGVHRLIGGLLYGSGLRILECLRLRIKDLDFDYRCIHVHNGKGGKDRIVTLPDVLASPLRDHCHQTRLTHTADLQRGFGRASLPSALARKYANAASEWKWQYVFPSSRISTDPRSGNRGRHHLDISAFQKIMRKSVQQADIGKPASAHTLRHSFATHALENGMDIRTVQQQLGHASLETTEIYTHVLHRGGLAVRSPLQDIFPDDSD